MTEQVAVVGSGYMGGGIAQVIALSGRQVVLADVTAEQAAQSRERIIRKAQDFEARELLPLGAATRIAEGVVAAASIEEAVAAADIVEEAVPEILAVKHETLRRISAAAPSTAVIGSNTSTISIASLAEAVERPERFLGVHFSNPATFIPGVEVIPHAGTDRAVVARVIGLLAECGKTGVEVPDVTGFVLNRLQYALFTEASRLVEEGVATAESIDTIARTTFGFRLPFFGPFAIADIAGLDVYEFCYGSLGEAYPERFAEPAALRDRVARGELGVKSGRGFLATPPERSAELVAYRDRAYAAMAVLLDEIGPAPVDY
ncbi:3-hydroxyacyl-CoA dehydrogenase family protein [Microbacterium sp. SSW1-49]|uniref:3-hydroxyacyl-CoA dehydrogenase family protein n=1 Tax=Microbacterium croceum TaxID=2851645 RepID=A0ABT0F965_9MICO|nr:3-hydroxyacyl-CoA dehydrogenase family protein [Microbacterium croceum]MCK2034597.1 3-hydroxyacyl-CoA dehydrogenase family protein [Microbacterium croceum]